jgi:hypothetical protein
LNLQAGLDDQSGKMLEYPSNAASKIKGPAADETVGPFFSV